MQPTTASGAATVLSALALVAAWLTAGWSEARAAERVAVVIGNGDYRSERLPDLPNAGRDAAAIAAALERRGFRVIAAQDVPAAAFPALFAQAEALEPADALLVFFAGHAVGTGGDTLLLPADAPEPESPARLAAASQSLGGLMQRLASPERPLLVFLDACAEAPAPRSGSNAVPLADNVFLALASQPGEPAWDGTGRGNSPFTRALVQAIELPGLPLGAAMAHASRETARLTVGRQVPWSRSTLREAFSFTAEGAAAPPGG